jgi:hypothetical protein
MNDQQRAAMQMALDGFRAVVLPLAWASEREPMFNSAYGVANEAILALREALAQADKPHIVRDGGNWGMSPRYKCSACDEEFRSEHRAHWHCQNECKALAQPQCNQHPDAPHGFDRNASHNADRYVCECESWEPQQGFRSINERIAELEQDHKMKAALDRARDRFANAGKVIEPLSLIHI